MFLVLTSDKLVLKDSVSHSITKVYNNKSNVLPRFYSHVFTKITVS